MNQRRSRLEQKFEYILNDLNIPYTYETTVIPYIIPESQHKYTVDWSFPHNNIHIESKGYLSDNAERQKYILIKKQKKYLRQLLFLITNGILQHSKYQNIL